MHVREYQQEVGRIPADVNSGFYANGSAFFYFVSFVASLALNVIFYLNCDG